MLQSVKIKSINLVVALAMVTIFTTLQSSSCSKKDDVDIINNTPAIAGTYRISFYWDKKDETSNFSGYNFSFNSGGQATATKGSITVKGNWSESSSKFIVDFGTDAVLSDLNDDWQIVEKTASSIKLKDDNPLQDDQVTFTKN
jgi:hypothetical protein